MEGSKKAANCDKVSMGVGGINGPGEGCAACVNVYSSVEFDCTWKCLYASVEPKSSMMLCRLSFMAWKINFCLRFAAPSSCNATKLKRFRRKLT